MKESHILKQLSSLVFRQCLRAFNEFKCVVLSSVVIREFVVGLCVSCVLGFGASHAFAEQNDSYLSQADFANKLRQNHPNFTRDALDREIALQNVTIQNSGQEWQLQLQAQQAHQEQLLASFGPQEIDQTLLDASMGRQIWKTGASLSLGAQLSTDDNVYDAATLAASPFTNPTESQKQQVSLVFSQPLLKNYKGSQSSLSYDLSQENVELSSIQAEESQENFYAEMMDQYLDWVLLDEEFRINTQRFSLAEKQKQEIKKRYQKNLIEKVDFLRAQDSSRLSKQQLLLSRSKLAAKSQSLARLSNVTEVADHNPEFSLYEFPELPSIATLTEVVTKNSRQLKIFKNRYKQLKIQLQSLNNSTKPELNLDLSTAFKTEEQKGLASGIRNSDSGNDYSIGLNFKKNLGNNTARGQKQRTEIEIDQLLLEQRYIQMQLEARLIELHVQLQEMQNILSLNREAINSAKATLDEEIKIYQQGRSDFTNVIVSRDQIKNSQLNYANNAISYHKLHLQLLSLTDQLFVAQGK